MNGEVAAYLLKGMLCICKKRRKHTICPYVGGTEEYERQQPRTDTELSLSYLGCKDTDKGGNKCPKAADLESWFTAYSKVRGVFMGGNIGTLLGHWYKKVGALVEFRCDTIIKKIFFLIFQHHYVHAGLQVCVRSKLPGGRWAGSL